MPLHLQRAHALLGDPQSALAVAEGAKARSLAVLLAQQRLAASSSSGAARSGGSGDDDDDHAVADGGAAAIADLDGALTFDALAETAVEQRACIVVYSNYLNVALFIWLIDSKGALAA